MQEARLEATDSLLSVIREEREDRHGGTVCCLLIQALWTAFQGFGKSVFSRCCRGRKATEERRARVEGSAGCRNSPPVACCRGEEEQEFGARISCRQEAEAGWRSKSTKKSKNEVVEASRSAQIEAIEANRSKSNKEARMAAVPPPFAGLVMLFTRMGVSKNPAAPLYFCQTEGVDSVEEEFRISETMAVERLCQVTKKAWRHNDGYSKCRVAVGAVYEDWKEHEAFVLCDLLSRAEFQARTFDIALCILHWQLSVDTNLSKSERKIMKI